MRNTVSFANVEIPEKVLKYLGLQSKIDNFISKQKKVYIQPEKGEKPPKGKIIKRGKRGGVFYEAQKPSKKWLIPSTNRTLSGLAIPPNWSSAKISSNPKSSIQAVGLDQKNRKVYLYNTDFLKKTTAAKFARLKDFSKDISEIEEKIVQNFDKFDEARILYLIDKTGFRIGSQADTQAKTKAYGATTLLRKHVRIDRDIISFNFIGKKGILIQKRIKDKKLAESFSKIKDKNASLFKVNDYQVRKYLSKITSKPYKVKDFRTYLGTSIALKEIKKQPKPGTKTEFQKFRKQIAETVAKSLGNTYTISLKAYIAPFVFQQWYSLYPELAKQEILLKDFLDTIYLSPEVDWTEIPLPEEELEDE